MANFLDYHHKNKKKDVTARMAEEGKVAEGEMKGEGRRWQKGEGRGPKGGNSKEKKKEKKRIRNKNQKE